MSSHLEPIPARSLQKSKAGCGNCKLRKVKCDERHPLCGNCARRYPNLATCFDDDAAVFVPQDSTTGIAGPSREPQNFGLSAFASRVSGPQLSIGSGQLDPFDTHPASKVPNVDVLLKHYLSSLVLQSFPFFHTGAIIQLWWPFLRTDTVLFHISLHLSARNLEALQQQADRTQSTFAKIEALRLLNETIRRDIQPSDQSMIAVANFITLEHEGGNMKSLKLHMDALRRMVDLRGGLDAVNSTNPMAADIIFWMSMIATNGPQLTPMKFEYLSSEQGYHFTGYSAFHRIGVAEPLISLLFEVNELTKQFSATVHSTSASEGLTVLRQLCSVLQRLLQPPATLGESPDDSGVSDSLRYAGALHILFPLMGHYPDPTLMVNALVHKLKESLIEYIFQPAAADPVLLWCLGVGAASAYQMPERNWFIGHLVVTTADLEVTSWQELRTVLTGIMSHAIFCENEYQAVWHDVVAKGDN